MTLNDLEKTLKQTIADGQIGTPVALRMHIRLAERSCDCVIATILLANRLFQSTPSRLLVRGEGTHQRTSLVSYASGSTLFVTVECGIVTESSVQLLLIGNHGVANLEPASWAAYWEQLDVDEAARYRNFLQASYREERAVTLGG